MLLFIEKKMSFHYGISSFLFTSDGYGTKCCQQISQGANVYCTDVYVECADVLTKEKKNGESKT